MSSARTRARPDGSDWYLSLGRIIHSEWIKAYSLRTTRRWALSAVSVGIVVGVVFALALPIGSLLDLNSERSEEVLVVTFGISVTQLIAGVVGVLTLGNEYGSGSIYSTFISVPRRWPAVFGKVVVVVVSTYLLGLLTMVLTAAITAPILQSRGVPNRLTDPLVFGPILGGALYVGLIAAIGFFFAAIIRSTAGAISVTVGTLLVLPTLLGVLGAVPGVAWMQQLVSFLPSTAGARLYAYAGTSGYLVTGGASTTVVMTAAQGLLVLLAWIVALGILAFALLKGRDA